MSARLLAAIAVLVLCSNAQERQSSPPPQSPTPAVNDIARVLPIQRVVLYKNGVGYFEHVGKVRGRQDVNIAFTSGQLNDVLKSLTVLDLDGGRISGVGYGSSAPVDRELGDLKLPSDRKSTLAEYLGALRGANIEVRSGTQTMTGRLLSIERKTRVSGTGNALEIDYVSLLTDTGELKTTELSPQFSVRLLDRGLSRKLTRYLDLVSSEREADSRQMTISTDGTGERSLFVSYISEVPVWKATYRLVTNSKNGKPPLLQGWAIVDNTVGQDWTGLQLSLVSGAPQSFVQHLSQPFYSRRPVVPLPESANQAPQTYQATMIAGGATIAGTVKDASGAFIAGATVQVFDTNGALIGQGFSGPNGAYEVTGLPQGIHRIDIQSPGFQTHSRNSVMLSASGSAMVDATLQVGNMTQTVEVTGEAAMLNTEKALTYLSSGVTGSGRNLGRPREGGRTGSGGGAGFVPGSGANTGSGVFRTSDAREAALAAANSQQVGDLFEYKLKEPITIMKNRSALVPIIQSQVAAEKVSVWRENSGRARAALWLTNTTGSTLDGGTFSVLDDETFAGEGIFEPIRAGEKRLISYAVDLGLQATTRFDSIQTPVTRVRLNKGMLVQDSEVREKKTYTIRNENTDARMMLIEHPTRPGYELASTARPDETTERWLRFRVPVAAKQTTTLAIEEARPVSTSVAVTSLGPDFVATALRARKINAEVERELYKVFQQQQVVAKLESEKEALETERQAIFDDQQRLRENMKSLKGSAEEKALVQRYTQQLDQQESRLEQIQKLEKAVEEKINKEQEALSAVVESLNLDVKL